MSMTPTQVLSKNPESSHQHHMLLIKRANASVEPLHNSGRGRVMREAAEWADGNWVGWQKSSGIRRGGRTALNDLNSTELVKWVVLPSCEIHLNKVFLKSKKTHKCQYFLTTIALLRIFTLLITLPRSLLSLILTLVEKNRRLRSFSTFQALQFSVLLLIAFISEKPLKVEHVSTRRHGGTGFADTCEQEARALKQRGPACWRLPESPPPSCSPSCWLWQSLCEYAL